MRVNSDKQTLILAGEAIPRRGAVNSSTGDPGLSDMGPRLTIVATRADSTMLLAHGDSAAGTRTAGEDSMFAVTLPISGQNKLERSAYVSSARGPSFHAANEYARTQDFWGDGTRSTIIDTYA